MTTETTAPDAALLPCPFCGDAPYMEPDDPETEGDSWTRISCVNVDCDVVCEVKICADDTHQAEAIAAWNRRAGQSHTAGLLAALERSTKGWENALELGLLPEMYRKDAETLAEQGRAAIAAAKGADK